LRIPFNTSPSQQRPGKRTPSDGAETKSVSQTPIISPDLGSKPAISRPYYSTLIPRGINGDRERPDKPITYPSRKNKPGIPPRQKEPLDKKFLQLLQSPCVREPRQRKQEHCGIAYYQTLIPNLGSPWRPSRNSFGIVRFFPSPSHPGLRPDRPVSPILTSRQEMVFGK
jgi:hypothetical protein